MKDATPVMNHSIAHQQVRCIHENGHDYGVIPTSEALSLAETEKMDLVLVSGDSGAPVAKIINYGRFVYDKKKSKQRQPKAKSLKEIKLRHVIEGGDLAVKAKHTKHFLEEGHRVKVTMQFRGRELNFVGLGKTVIEDFLKSIDYNAKVEKPLNQEGRLLTLLLAP